MKKIAKIIKTSIRRLGFDISRIDQVQEGWSVDSPEYVRLLEEYSGILEDLNVKKIHYGCGRRLFGDGWVNVDRNMSTSNEENLYMSADLTFKHPFPSDHFLFAFAEDFLEHLTQDESLIFLSEVFRCLQTGGVLRLSFPGLSGILRQHYRSSDFEGAAMGRREAFTLWGHQHYYCEESLTVVSQHIGFSKIDFVTYGVSKYDALKDLDHRVEQQHLNIYAELIK